MQHAACLKVSSVAQGNSRRWIFGSAGNDDRSGQAVTIDFHSFLEATMRREDDDQGRRPKNRSAGGEGVACPKCGSRSQRTGPWPWYLGTLGAILCKAVICNECDHEFDAKKPQANLASRKRNLAILVNGLGFVGIIAVIGLLALWISVTIK